MKHLVFITGATGYMGSRLIPKLLEHGHEPVALVRESSRGKVPAVVCAGTGAFVALCLAALL